MKKSILVLFSLIMIANCVNGQNSVTFYPNNALNSHFVGYAFLAVTNAHPLVTAEVDLTSDGKFPTNFTLSINHLHTTPVNLVLIHYSPTSKVYNAFVTIPGYNKSIYVEYSWSVASLQSNEPPGVSIYIHVFP